MGVRGCYVCQQDVDARTFKDHLKIHVEDFKAMKFSNNLSDACKTSCKICGKLCSIQGMRTHTKSKHDMVITVYKERFNQQFFDLVEKVFHKCGICGEPVLLDTDKISTHLINNKRTHRMTHKEYNEAFMQYSRNSTKTKHDKTEHDSKESVEGKHIVKSKSVRKPATVEQFRRVVRGLGHRQPASFPAVEAVLGPGWGGEEAVLRAARLFSQGQARTQAEARLEAVARQGEEVAGALVGPGPGLAARRREGRLAGERLMRLLEELDSVQLEADRLGPAALQDLRARRKAIAIGLNAGLDRSEENLRAIVAAMGRAG
jgi:hypothetical protein